jgi:phosphoadenosine phosphosulfate reductase
MTTTFDELELQNDVFEHSAPSDILQWAFDKFTDVVMACSFEDIALLHMVRELQPSTEIIFLDTGQHFPETLEFAARIEREWRLNLTRTHPGPDADAWPCGTSRCCELRKVEPLKKALSGKSAWITSLRRSDSPSRAQTKIVSWDDTFNLVKVNPLATWSDADVDFYLKANALPEHPLWTQGYTSIGCAPVTTKPTSAQRRSGRWAGAEKDECGLHIQPDSDA